MPFQSEKQRRYLWLKRPDIARAWAHGRSSKTGRKEHGRKHTRKKKGRSRSRR